MAGWFSTLTHSHHLRGGDESLESASRKLVDWCQKEGIRAFGVGSPWEPVSQRNYVKYETTHREQYDAGQVDLEPLKNEQGVREFLEGLNRMSGGKTFFYLDNETPKARYGHLWWLNWHYDVPPWHDYSQDRPIQYYRNDPEQEWNPVAGRPFRRRPYLEILRNQRAHGALGVWAHPTSWWREEGKFITNIAAEAGLHLLAQGFLDGLVVMGYDVFQSHYQALWFDWLDTGAVIPGFAESDMANSQIGSRKGHPLMISHLYCPDGVSVEALTEAGRSGMAVATTGGLAVPRAGDVNMGSVLTLAKGEERDMTVDLVPTPGEDYFSRVEILGRGGKVLFSRDHVPAGRLTLKIQGDGRPDYRVVRAYGAYDHPEMVDPMKIRHLVLSNPLYLHPPGFVVEPVHTELTLSADSNSPYANQPFELRSFEGEILEQGALDKVRKLRVPADAFLNFPGMSEPWPLYPCMENQAAQNLLAYLWQGHFLKDFPKCQPGHVPPEAWRMNELRDALASQTLIL